MYLRQEVALDASFSPTNFACRNWTADVGGNNTRYWDFRYVQWITVVSLRLMVPDIAPGLNAAPSDEVLRCGTMKTTIHIAPSTARAQMDPTLTLKVHTPRAW